MTDEAQNRSNEGQEDNTSVWIFGYGSLLWKVNFPYQTKVVGHVKGYSRKFWQGSTDHRGVPGAPGRVATVVEAAKESTWGVAYKVDPNDIPEVMSYLNHREKNGYTTKELLFYPKKELDLTPFHILLYIGTVTNPMYLGPAPIEAIAEQVLRSRGPSGCNAEYVINLARSMREIAPSAQDDHLFALEKQINEIVEVSMVKRRFNRLKRKDSECTCDLCDLISRT